MAQRNRETLKSCFKQGSKPNEKDFENLIDSMMNILDDGISKTTGNGLDLSPDPESDTVLSVSREQSDHEPLWKIAINEDNELEIRRCGGDEEFRAWLLKRDGTVVVGNEETLTLQHGAIRAKHREGTLYEGCIDADGKWHNITGELAGIQALEITAYAGNTGDKKQSVLIAAATCCSGRHANITQTMSHSRRFTHKIRLRWQTNKKAGTARLQAKTVWRYGNDRQIRYNITGLIRHDRTES